MRAAYLVMMALGEEKMSLQSLEYSAVIYLAS